MRSASLLRIGCAAIGMFLIGCAPGGSSPQSTISTAERPAAAEVKPSPVWDISLDNIEACSCPTFCQCYFNDRPAMHEAGNKGHEHAMRYCRFNNAFHVEKGHYGDTALDGLKFWMAGDLGGNFSTGQMDWAMLHFEPAATPEQREALKAIIGAIFPVKWNSFAVGADAKIDWQKQMKRPRQASRGERSPKLSLSKRPARTISRSCCRTLSSGQPRATAALRL